MAGQVDKIPDPEAESFSFELITDDPNLPENTLKVLITGTQFDIPKVVETNRGIQTFLDAADKPQLIVLDLLDYKIGGVKAVKAGEFPTLIRFFFKQMGGRTVYNHPMALKHWIVVINKEENPKIHNYLEQAEKIFLNAWSNTYLEYYSTWEEAYLDADRVREMGESELEQ